MYGRGQLRIAESVGEARALREEVRDWQDRWDAIDAMGAHLTQLDVLCGVVTGLVDEIEARAAAIDPGASVGAVYEQCRSADRRLLHARRLWRWYADKFDQRTDDGDVTTATLLAADEVIWSCWKAAFGALGEAAPPAPVPYLALQFSASTTPRADPPDGLRPGADDLLRKHVEELPVAAVGLPPVCCRRPWWLIVSAHEVSHHVQFESDGLEDATQERVVAAAYQASDDLMAAERWRPWCRELFADAGSVLLVGPAASWSVAELELRTLPGLRKSPAGGYPPPLVRLAVLAAVAEQAGLPSWPRLLPGQAELGPDDPAADDLADLMDCVPAVAAALLGLTSAAGRPLRALAAAAAAAYRDQGAVAGWQRELLGPGEPAGREALDAARFCAAGGVQAWYRLAGQDGQAALAERLSGRLRAVLPRCRAPGSRGAATVPDVGALTRKFAADLFAGGRE